MWVSKNLEKFTNIVLKETSWLQHFKKFKIIFSAHSKRDSFKSICVGEETVVEINGYFQISFVWFQIKLNSSLSIYKWNFYPSFYLYFSRLIEKCSSNIYPKLIMLVLIRVRMISFLLFYTPWIIMNIYYIYLNNLTFLI